MREPYLSAEDHRIWEAWVRECEAWSRTRAHARAVRGAARIVDEMMERAPGAYLAWSGGKDSTVMLDLALWRGFGGRVLSVKDDLDYPGELEYVRRVAAGLGISDRLDVVTPPFSLLGELAELAAAGDLSAADDFHGRASDFSQRAFYGPIADYRDAAGRPGVYLGLRRDESRGRALNRAVRGAVYRKGRGDQSELVCTPIVDWTDRDVYAWAIRRGLELFEVYRCVRLHDSPAQVRKSWWLPGSHSSRGGMVWLRTYYPSLYLKLREALPDASAWS